MLALPLNSVLHLFDIIIYFILFKLQIKRFSFLRIIKTRKYLSCRSIKETKHNFKRSNSVVRTLKERAEDSYRCRV